MKESVHQHCRIGLIPFMAYPGMSGEEDPDILSHLRRTHQMIIWMRLSSLGPELSFSFNPVAAAKPSRTPLPAER